MVRKILVPALVIFTLSSCVSSKKFKASEQRYRDLYSQYTELQKKLNNCNTQTSECQAKNQTYETQLGDLRKQIDYLKENNTQALKQLEDLSVISGSQAKSIAKSLENIGAKDA